MNTNMKTQPSESKSYFQNNKKMIFTLIVLLLILCGLLAYIFVSNRTANNIPAKTPIVSTPVVDPVVSSPALDYPPQNSDSSYTPVVPEGWSLQPVEGCSASLILPPASGKYYEESDITYSKWYFHQSPKIGTVGPFNGGALEYYGMFSKENNNNLGSDSNVNTRLACEPGTLSNDDIALAYTQNGNTAKVVFGGTVNKWGVEAQIITFKTEHFQDSTDYIVRKNGYTYLIGYEDSGITAQIANNIIFN